MIIINKLAVCVDSAIAAATNEHAHVLTKYIGLLIVQRVAVFAGQAVKITASRCHSLIKLI